MKAVFFFLALATTPAFAQEMSAELSALDVTTNAPALSEIEQAFNETPQTRAESQWAKMPNDGFVKAATYSEFFFLPAGGQNSAQFNYRQKSSPITGTNYDNQTGELKNFESNLEAKEYDLHYARSVARSTYLTIDVGYEAETVSSGETSLRSSGLKDIGFGFTQVNRFERWNLLWGSNFKASPGDAFRPTAAGVRGNRFSGGYAAIPFIGFETTSHTAAWGARLQSKIAYKQYGDTGFNQPLSATGLAAFYEVPVLDTVRVGFNAEAQRNSTTSFGDLKNVFDTFGAGAYSRISLKQQADILLGITASNTDRYETSTTETEATIGLRKSL